MMSFFTKGQIRCRTRHGAGREDRRKSRDKNVAATSSFSCIHQLVYAPHAITEQLETGSQSVSNVLQWFRLMRIAD